MGCILSCYLRPIIKIYEECSICLENLDYKSDIIELRCRHIYHKKCIQQWFERNNVCPICLFKI